MPIWQLGPPFSSPISTLSLRPSEPPSGKRVVGGGGRGRGKGYGKRKIFAWPVYRLLGFIVKPVFLHISGEPPVWGHTDAWVAHRSQQWSFPWAGTQEFHPQGQTKGHKDPGFTPSPEPRVGGDAPGNASAAGQGGAGTASGPALIGSRWFRPEVKQSSRPANRVSATVRLLCARRWSPGWAYLYLSFAWFFGVFFKPRLTSFRVLSSLLFNSRLPSQISMQEEDASPRGFLPRFQHFATQAIHVGQEPEQWTSQAVVPPISLSTTFKQGAPGRHLVSWVCLGRSSVGR